MKRVRIYIANESEFLDPDVYITIWLPSVPAQGDILFLREKKRKKLEAMATKNVDIATKYAYGYMYGKSVDKEYIDESDLKNLSFSDVHWVKDVIFIANSLFPCIELCNSIILNELKQPL